MSETLTGEPAALWFRETFSAIRREVGKRIVGQEGIVEGVLVGLAANGHVLLEGMPGLGKTLLVKTLSEALSMSFSRIQFTPDLMPADITGTNVLVHTDEGSRGFELRKGPIFAHIVLADEINRATPKTQSAMLEAMQERAVTIAGKRHDLDEPFLVLATQNPIEQEGTYVLPEAQVDRFFLKLLVPFPTKEDLAAIVARTTSGEPEPVQPVADAEKVLQMRRIAREVPVPAPVMELALSLVVGTHPESPDAGPKVKQYVRYGSSPRGAQALITAAKILALLDGRYNVAKEDLLKAMRPALRHRLLLNFEAEADRVSADSILDDVFETATKRDRDPIRV